MPARDDILSVVGFLNIDQGTFSELLLDVVENASDGIAIEELTGDPDVPTRFLYVNANFERVTGFTREEILSENNPLFRAQPNRTMLERMAHEIRAGRDARFEIQLSRRDGSSYWAEIVYSPLTSRDGRTYFLCVGRDMTERRAQEAERLTLYRAIEALSDFVIVMDVTPPSQGGPFIVYANAAYARALGYLDAKELVGRPCWDFISPDNLPLLMAQLTEGAETLKPQEKEVQLRRRDGSTIWIEFSGLIVCDDAGNPERWIAVGRDITTRRQESERESLLLRAIDATPNPFRLYAEQNGRFVNVFENEVAQKRPQAEEQALRAAAASVNGETHNGERLVPLRGAGGAIDAIVGLAD